jgi:16S rRNA (cytidine1402-2'-O)-methyltransferase
MESHPYKGEVVLLFSGQQKATEVQWEHLTPEEHVLFIQDIYKLSKREAIKMAAEMRGVSKRDIYNIVHRIV